MQSMAIFYFSGTGNTWWVAMRIAEQLGVVGVDTSVYSIEALCPARANTVIRQVDAVAFAYPVYGSDIPGPMKMFMGELAPVSHKETLVFCTQWLWSGDGARVATELIGGKGYVVKWAEHFLMPSNLSLPMFPIPLHSNKAAVKNRFLRFSEHRISKLTQKITKGQTFRRGFNSVSQLSGFLQRAPYRRYLENKWGSSITVSKELCVACGLCVRLCPTKNLVMDNGHAVAGHTCAMCLRCYNFCPQTAILYKGRHHNVKHGEPYRGPIQGFDPAVLTRSN